MQQLQSICGSQDARHTVSHRETCRLSFNPEIISTLGPLSGMPLVGADARQRNISPRLTAAEIGYLGEGVPPSLLRKANLLVSPSAPHSMCVEQA
jgi:hypothetical protein